MSEAAVDRPRTAGRLAVAAAAPSPGSRRPKPRHRAAAGAGGKKDGVRSAVEWVAVIVGALVVALVVKTFLFQAFYIPSASMEPTLKKGDRVLVNKLSYDLHDVHRGDIVVFTLPPDKVGPGRHQGPDQAGHRPARARSSSPARGRCTSTASSSRSRTCRRASPPTTHRSRSRRCPRARSS